MAKEIVLEVKGVSKSFRLPLEKSNGIKNAFINFVHGRRGYKMQHVLHGISFTINKGDFFGIVGRNGSGKSTLLKLISNIYMPDHGKISVNGSLVPFIELGVGFNPELTGRENVYLNGALLGFSNDEIDEMYDDIVDFAELHEFMNQKLKNYSSGMQVRLAFSVAIKAQGDILVLDEVLAVGDEAFQKKCSDYFGQIRKDKDKTVILVTHDMGAVRKYCNKAILIRNGEIVVNGVPNVVADEYSLENIENVNKPNDKVKNNTDKPTIFAKIIGSPMLNNTDRIQIEVKYKNVDARPVYPKIVINFQGVPIIGANAKLLHNLVTSDTKEHVVKYELPLTKFNKGQCSIVTLLVDSKQEVNLADFGYNNELIFRVKNVKTGEKIGGIFKDYGHMELAK